MIGTLIYAAIGTRPDIAFAATRLSQYNNNPTKEHIKYMKYVLKYLKGTKALKIKYDRGSDAGLIRYSDSNGAISWALQQQKTVVLSVGEAEYMELASTG